jgi:hypothetical protein
MMELGIAVSGERTEKQRGLKKFERATMTRIGRRQINTRQRCWQCFLPARQSRSAQISPKPNSVSTLTPPDPQGFSGSASEIIADNLSASGWSWGCISAIDSNGRTIWIADAHRDDGQRFAVHADEHRRRRAPYPRSHSPMGHALPDPIQRV